MALMTKEQYIESLRKLNLKVYMFGKQVKNIIDDPIIRPSLDFSGSYVRIGSG